MREHRAWAREALGFRTFDDAEQKEFKSALDVRGKDAASVAELVTYAQEWLFERKVVLPGASTLEEAAAQAYRVVEDLALATVRGAIKPARLRAILRMMFDEGASPGTTVLEWLRQAAGKHGVKNLHEVSSRITYLKTLGAHEWDLGVLSQSRIQAFAQRVIHRPPSETSRRVFDTQAVEII